ncbi:hypothetical protein ACOSQ2_022444 [Xanthoceras sorbifolium]
MVTGKVTDLRMGMPILATLESWGIVCFEEPPDILSVFVGDVLGLATAALCFLLLGFCMTMKSGTGLRYGEGQGRAHNKWIWKWKKESGPIGEKTGTTEPYSLSTLKLQHTRLSGLNFQKTRSILSSSPTHN